MNAPASYFTGQNVTRIDGAAKVTGMARYPDDEPNADPAFAWLVTSAIARGRIRKIDLAEARSVPGVLDILTHENVGDEVKPPKGPDQGKTTTTLESDQIWYDGQIIAVVIANSFEAAREAGYKVQVEYDAQPPSATFGSPGVETERKIAKQVAGALLGPLLEGRQRITAVRPFARPLGRQLQRFRKLIAVIETSVEDESAHSAAFRQRLNIGKILPLENGLAPAQRNFAAIPEAFAIPAMPLQSLHRFADGRSRIPGPPVVNSRDRAHLPGIRVARLHQPLSLHRVEKRLQFDAAPLRFHVEFLHHPFA